MEGILSVKINKINGTVVSMPQIFKGIKCDFGEYIIRFEYNANACIVNIESKKLNEKKLEKIFWSFYNYMGFVIGYFPNILEINNSGEEKLANIVEQYKTKDNFIRESEQYIESMTEKQFETSFKLFLQLEAKASLQFSMFNVSMMKSNHYPEIAIINLLQSLDGLFEVLYSNQKIKKEINILKIKRIKEKLNSFDVNNIIDKELNSINDNMEKINKILYIDKLYYFLDIIKFDIFRFEKKLDLSNEYYFESLLSKLVNTRNKFSHIVNKNNVLNGKAAAVYIFKLIILYRLLVFEKIGIIELINETKFYENLDEWDNYIFKTLN